MIIKNKRNSRVLVIGDSHIQYNDDLLRFYKLVKYIKKNKIQLDYIVLIGDFLTMECLSSWENNKREIMDNNYLSLEIKKGKETLDILSKLNIQIIYIKGNHEFRLDKYINYHRATKGILELEKLLDLSNRNIPLIDYRKQLIINNVSFTHIPISANGQPLNCLNICRAALNIFGNSVVFGHTHQLKIEHSTRLNTPFQMAVNVGCFFEEDPDYLDGAAVNYWKGVVFMDIQKDGKFDLKTVSMESLK